MYRQPTAAVLLYHRIASPHTDPAKLCVSEEVFEKHLRFLKRYRTVVSLPEMERRIKEASLTGNEVAITFDDGYKDNLEKAVPLLEKYSIPATIFITTGQLGMQANFAWDQDYSEDERAHFLSEDNIRVLSKHSLIQIGAHTDTHPRLGELPREQQAQEIMKSKNILETITGHRISVFAYPFGGRYDFTEQTERITRDIGFDAAYANTQMLLIESDRLYALPRINVRNYGVPHLAFSLYIFHFFTQKLGNALSIRITRAYEWYWKLKSRRIRRKYSLTALPPCYWVRDTLTPHSVAVDAGTGETADFSIALIDRFGLRSYGIDPTRKHAPLLQRLSSAEERFNHLAYALGDKNETLTFYESIANESGSRFNNHVNVLHGDVRAYNVQSVTVEDLFSIVSTERIDILKIDIEGGEYDVLKKIDPRILEKIDQLIVEFHHGTVSNYTVRDTNEVRKKLRQNGYTEFTSDGINFLFFKS